MDSLYEQAWAPVESESVREFGWWVQWDKLEALNCSGFGPAPPRVLGGVPQTLWLGICKISLMARSIVSSMQILHSAMACCQMFHIKFSSHAKFARETEIGAFGLRARGEAYWAWGWSWPGGLRFLRGGPGLLWQVVEDLI